MENNYYLCYYYGLKHLHLYVRVVILFCQMLLTEFYILVIMQADPRCSSFFFFFALIMLIPGDHSIKTHPGLSFNMSDINSLAQRRNTFNDNSASEERSEWFILQCSSTSSHPAMSNFSPDVHDEKNMMDSSSRLTEIESSISLQEIPLSQSYNTPLPIKGLCHVASVSGKQCAYLSRCPHVYAMPQT